MMDPETIAFIKEWQTLFSTLVASVAAFIVTGYFWWRDKHRKIIQEREERRRLAAALSIEILMIRVASLANYKVLEDKKENDELPDLMEIRIGYIFPNNVKDVALFHEELGENIVLFYGQVESISRMLDRYNILLETEAEIDNRTIKLKKKLLDGLGELTSRAHHILNELRPISN